MKKIFPNMGRPDVSRVESSKDPIRIPRSRRKKKEKPKNFLPKHIWYNAWGVVGLTGLALAYETKPDWARKMLSAYIFLWVAGGIGLPSFLSSRKNSEEGDRSRKVEIDIE